MPASKDRAKMRFSHSTRGKDGHFRFGAYMYYIPPNRTPHFCHWPNRATRSLPGLCPLFAQRFQIFARFLLAEKLLDFQDFPVIAKQRCFNLIVLLYTTCDKKCLFNFLQPSFFLLLLASSWRTCWCYNKCLISPLKNTFFPKIDALISINNAKTSSFYHFLSGFFCRPQKRIGHVGTYLKKHFFKIKN